jgi:tRNA threonylcarbamoyladenosine biosynthesis protein TsaE
VTAAQPAPAGPDEPRVARHLTAASAEATREIGAALGRAAGPGDVLALSGDLGAGKTCLVQGVAAGLGAAGPVTSPTFILVNEHVGRLVLYHVDLYRTDSLEEIRALGLEELFDGDGLTVVEWAEKAEAILPPRAVWVRIQGAGDEPRGIDLEGPPRLLSALGV